MKETSKRNKVLAVASSGGHWVQLRRVVPAFFESEVVYVTVLESYRSQVPANRFYSVNDATRWNKPGLIMLALRLAWIIMKERPSVVISTGAAPGYFAVLLGRWFGARTIWIDSMANIEDLSMSGSRAGRYADLWLTIVWVTYLLVFLGTIIKRKEPHIYVANWYYGAFIIAVCQVLLLLHGYSTQIQYLAIGVIVLLVIMLQTLADAN